MLNFISLGSGSSGNCYFIFSETEGFFIDAGIGIRNIKRLLRLNGFSLDKVKAVFVTHDHADHIKAVGTLANDYDIPIYATPLVHEGINKNYCVTSKLTSKHIHYIQKEETIRFGEFEIMPFEVPHDSSDNVGYTVRRGETTFCLITDVGHVTETIAEQVRQANYLVLESNHDEDMLKMGPYPAYLKGRISSGRGHLSNREAGRLLAEHASEALRKVWLCHLSEENNHPELARKTVDAVLRSYGLIAGKDFEVEVLKRKVPSPVYELSVNAEKSEPEIWKE